MHVLVIFRLLKDSETAILAAYMSAAKRNKIYLEIIRILAIFLVVINHTCAFSFPNVEGVGDVWYWSQLLFDEIVKMAVPLFFMVSGALLFLAAT